MKKEIKELATTQSRPIIKSPQTSFNVSINREKQRIYNEYGTFENILFSFSPSVKSNKGMPLEEAYKSNAPTLTYLDLCYGEGSAKTWLVLWVSSIYGVCGFKEGATDNVKIETANAIMSEYYYLNLNELVVFFNKFVAGNFEKFYNKPNPQVITKSLNEFLSIRLDVVKKVELNKRKEAERQEKNDDKAISYEEWVAVKKAKGEAVNIELIVDGNGNKLFCSKKPKEDPMLESAYMIVRNTSFADYDTLGKLRDSFVKKYGIDPYEFIKKLGKKKLEDYEKGRNSKFDT